MRKVWAVAAREYRTHVRSKAFVIAIVLVPIFMFGSIGVQVLMEKKGETGSKRIAVLDYSNKMFDKLKQAAEVRNEKEIFDESGTQRESKFEFIKIASEQDTKAQLLKLSDEVRSGQYFAVVEIAPSILSSDDPGFGLRYYSEQQAYRDLPRWLNININNIVQSYRFAEAGLNREVVEKALAAVPREDLNLLSRSETGEIKEAQKADELTTIMPPFALAMLMFMCLMTTTQPLLNGVIEEKTRRIAEVLLGSLRPFELMLGKMTGHLLVAITLLAIYLCGGYFVANHFGQADMFAPHLIALFLLLMVFGVLIFGSLFLAIGACCNDLKDAQSLIMPVMFPMIVPLFVLVPVIKDPNGTLATTMSLIPIWTPMTMAMRLAMPSAVPAWQIPVSLLGCALASMLCLWAAGRIFRIGLLMQGKAPKLTDMVRWAVAG